MLKCLLVLLLTMLVAPAMARQTIPISPHKRLSATISATAMNRLAVENDRIAQVFGDEGSFVTQTDEATGQVFIKPTPENGSKSLSLTVITENNLTQDLLLKPTEGEPQTIVLQGVNLPDEATPKAADKMFGKALPLQEVIVSLSKKAVTGELNPLEMLEATSRSGGEGVSVSYQCSYAGGEALIHVFKVENPTDQPLHLHEKSFYQPGDIALCLKELVLEPNKSTELYVIGRS